MLYASGPGGLGQAAGLAGGPPGGALRRLGPPACGPAHQTVWERLLRGQHQNLLVRLLSLSSGSSLHVVCCLSLLHRDTRVDTPNIRTRQKMVNS